MRPADIIEIPAALLFPDHRQWVAKRCKVWCKYGETPVSNDKEADNSVANKIRFFLAIFCAVSLFMMLSPHSAEARRRPQNNDNNPRYAMIIMDAQTGRILDEKNADRALPPASLTKIMTLFMVFDALQRKQITMDTYLTVTTNAMNQAPSKIGLRLGDKMTIRQAILVLVTRSANDVATALAETIGGSERRFTELMTARARSLGMQNSAFYNPSGLPNPGQKSSAHDMAILARAHMQYFPQYYHFFGTIRTSYNGRNVETHNNLMRRYPGMDGLKTGYTYASGFNLVSSAVRNNRRVIVAVFGGKSAAARDNHVADLMSRGLAILNGDQMVTQIAQAIAITPQPAIAAAITPPQKPVIAATPVAKQAQPAANTIAPAAGKNQATRTTIRFDGGIKPLQVPADPRPAPTPTIASAANRNWGIQVGAFSSSGLSQQTVMTIQTRLRSRLSNVGQGVIIPAQTAQGMVYRARIIGLSAQDASKACQIVPDCMAFTTR